jgi:hypothetical protein
VIKTAFVYQRRPPRDDDDDVVVTRTRVVVVAFAAEGFPDRRARGSSVD